MTPDRPECSTEETVCADGRPRLVGRVGSLDAFWPLMEPLLTRLQPRRFCEIGVDQGIFTERLLAWAQEHGCTYVGIDPAPAASVRELLQQEQDSPGRLIIGRSLEVLPGLEPCDAYFIDGDHNYHTVRHELVLIERASAATGPLVFAHDVGWPFARRDMYHDPDAVPMEERHPFSADLGVSLESDDLAPDGLRSPGRYAIARQAGGERNGVRTAIEDFLADDAGRDWKSLIVPIAYGLAILYRPAAVPGPCRVALEELGAACAMMGRFLESCEANFLWLYLYAETTKSQLAYWTGDGQPGQAAYEKLQRAYDELHSAYKNLTKHSDDLMRAYGELREGFTALEHRSRRDGET